MVNAELQDIEKLLQDKALSLEKARMAAHEAAMKEIADARAEEAKRIKEEQERIAAQHALTNKLYADKEKAYVKWQQQTRELQVLTDQEQNRRLAELEAEIAHRESIAKRLADMEHAEEMAKKALRDLVMSSAEHIDAERIVPNPLARFLQTEPK